MVEAAVLEEFARYPFDTDEVFQEGLSSILESQAPERRDDIIGQAKAYYFSSVTGHQVSWDEVRTALTRIGQLSRQSSDIGDSSQSDGRVLTFTEILTLIASNQTHLVPNNESIPGGTTEELPSVSRVEPRRKPWEVVAGLQ